MHDLRDMLQRAFSKKNGLQPRVIAVQQELDLWVAHMSDGHTVDDGLRCVVAPHGVNRNDEFPVHAGPIV